jgi:hypothetical protein
MFDPTAFDNMKVVLEGALYDRDLEGEILIIDRDDLVNLAKLSRKFEVAFRLVDESDSHPTTARVGLEARLENFAAELLGTPQTGKLAGSQLILSFLVVHDNNPAHFEKIDRMLKGIWGSTRLFSQTATFNPFADEGLILNEIKIEFERIIFEEQMEDLIEMIDYVVETLIGLRKITER